MWPRYSTIYKITNLGTVNPKDDYCPGLYRMRAS